MKLLLALCVLVLCVGCSNPNSPSERGSVQFRLDSNSCGPIFGNQSLTFTFFVDGVQVGSGSLGIGTMSQPFAVNAGAHTASARVTNSAATWENLNFSVAAKGTFTYLLLC